MTLLHFSKILRPLNRNSWESRWGGLTGLCLAVLAMACGRAADGPSSQQEAQAWLDEVTKIVEGAAGLAFAEKRRPNIKLANALEAGSVLGPEFGARIPAALRERLPAPETFGTQILARYSFDTRTIFLVPSNLSRILAAKNLNALDRMHLLKIVLAYACDIALLDSHVPLARLYYAPGGSDAALAQRAVWEGHARLVQNAAAEALGCETQAKVIAQMNSFVIAPEMEKKNSKHDQNVIVARATTMGRVAEVGARFVSAIKKKNGPKAILEAIQKPPLRTSQIMVPSDYLEGKGYEPADQLLGETLARAAGAFFPPQAWDNHSAPLGALSLKDIVAQTKWEGGVGPQRNLGDSFDMDYVAGRSLYGRHRTAPAARASALHVFRSAAAAKRFVTWKTKLIREDWVQLQKGRFGLKEKKDHDARKAELTSEAAKVVDGGRVLTTVVFRTDGTSFSDAHYYFIRGTWVLELNLDVVVGMKLLSEAVLEVAKSEAK